MLRRLRFIAVLPLILTLLLAACGADEDATSTPSGSGSADPTATAAEMSPTDESDETTTPGSIDLAGTEWVLTSLNGEDLPPEVTITLAFEQGQAGGNAACNEYGGAFTTSESGELSITDLHNTDMACGEPEGIMELESSYLEALGKSASFHATDERLELANTSGETTLVFAPYTSSALDGTSWMMVEFDGEPPVTDTHITITFEDGRVSGSGGCNTYGGDYGAGDETLSIETVEITEMGCPEPEGVMEQEQAYVDLIIQADSYHLDIPNNRLVILDASGRARIVFANKEEPNGTGFLDGTDWVLTHIDGQEVAPDPPATLIFRASQYSGEYGCLVYSGPLMTSSQGEVLYMPVHSHDHECEGVVIPDMGETYMAALERVTQYRLTGDRLDLLDEIGKLVLSYRPASTSQSGLNGTDWELVELNGSPPIPESDVTLSFTNGSAGGNAGCNGYGSPYTVAEEGMISLPEIISTAMACAEPPGVMDQETAYHQALNRVTGYRLTGDRLELTDEAGEVVLVYQTASDDQGSLDGTSWGLVTMNGSPPIDGTQITISFADGWIRGNSGCNNYGGEYMIVDDSGLSIPGPAFEAMACTEPPGVMDQEIAYRDALSQAVTYQLTGSTLELMNDAGETTLVYERK